MVSFEKMLEVAEGLARLDPVRDYPQRGAQLVSDLLGAVGFRLQTQDGHSVTGDAAPASNDATLSLPLRNGRGTFGTLHLKLRGGQAPVARELEVARWAARMLAHGLDYVERLSAAGGRRGDEELADVLERMPLTPREREVVALLVSGAGTRDIAEQTGLTVSTINTYLKRIFSKLGVHSRVELVAKMAGTDRFMSGPAPRPSFVRETGKAAAKKASSE